MDIIWRKKRDQPTNALPTKVIFVSTFRSTSSSTSDNEFRQQRSLITQIRKRRAILGDVQKKVEGYLYNQGDSYIKEIQKEAHDLVLKKQVESADTKSYKFSIPPKSPKYPSELRPLHDYQGSDEMLMSAKLLVKEEYHGAETVVELYRKKCPTYRQCNETKKIISPDKMSAEQQAIIKKLIIIEFEVMLYCVSLDYTILHNPHNLDENKGPSLCIMKLSNDSVSTYERHIRLTLDSMISTPAFTSLMDDAKSAEDSQILAHPPFTTSFSTSAVEMIDTSVAPAPHNAGTVASTK